MKRLVISLLLFAFIGSGNADESIGLEFPVQDARSAAAQRNYEFLGIELEEGVDLPGLSKEQQQVAKRKHKTRLLNYRWQTYTNIEERQREYVRIRKYATRYNLIMWQEMKQQKLKDFKKYRY